MTYHEQQDFCSVGDDGGRRPGLGWMANAKSIGWAIYAAGFVIWIFGCLSAGHPPVFDWDVATPSWISSFVPNLEAELGLALMFASMIPIYWRAGRKRGPSSAGGNGVRDPPELSRVAQAPPTGRFRQSGR